VSKKAEAALLAAIEIYNKPTFLYREETFSILALNAWVAAESQVACG